MTPFTRAALAAILVGMAGCRGDEGTMQVSWVHGPDTVTLGLPATAVSCPDLGWLEVVGASGDTGVGVVVFLEGTRVAGRRRAFSSRWLGDDVTYCERPGETSPPYPDIGLESGDSLRKDWFPVVWRRESGAPS